MPPEYQQVMNAGLISLNAEKQRLISTIVANEKSDFSEEWLKLQTPELLRGLAKIAAAPVHNDYAALGGGPTPMFAANGSTPAAGQKVEAPPTTEWDQEFAKV